jgi:hypothetical protein
MQSEQVHAGPRRLRLTLPPDLHAPAAARRALRTLPLGPRADDAILLASELVANAVLHAAHEADEMIELSAICEPGRTRVEVRDYGHGVCALELAEGYGLQVLAAASESWGIEHDGTTRAWFELRR